MSEPIVVLGVLTMTEAGPKRRLQEKTWFGSHIKYRAQGHLQTCGVQVAVHHAHVKEIGGGYVEISPKAFSAISANAGYLRRAIERHQARVADLMARRV